MKTLFSKQDASVNFITKAEKGFFESRFVQRSEDYFICYLSCQSGCNRRCAFCHLTTTGQTDSIDAWGPALVKQAEPVLRHAQKESTKARFMHYNFMARGEPLATESILNASSLMLQDLATMTRDYLRIPSRFNISTIIPKGLKKTLPQVFDSITPTIYYSLYSVNPEFRRKWLPTAMDPELAISLLKEYQDFSDKTVKIHFPFIKGENDSAGDVLKMCRMLESAGLRWSFNLVRYNSPDSTSQESDPAIIDFNLKIISDYTEVRQVPRVGLDVKASCGMFVTDTEFEGN
jgi:23S rRNA (adenine2503-C2)-methyltransferase